MGLLFGISSAMAKLGTDLAEARRQVEEEQRRRNLHELEQKERKMDILQQQAPQYRVQDINGVPMIIKTSPPTEQNPQGTIEFQPVPVQGNTHQELLSSIETGMGILERTVKNEQYMAALKAKMQPWTDALRAGRGDLEGARQAWASAVQEQIQLQTSPFLMGRRLIAPRMAGSAVKDLGPVFDAAGNPVTPKEESAYRVELNQQTQQIVVSEHEAKATPITKLADAIRIAGDPSADPSMREAANLIISKERKNLQLIGQRIAQLGMQREMDLLRKGVLETTQAKLRGQSAERMLSRAFSLAVQISRDPYQPEFFGQPLAGIVDAIIRSQLSPEWDAAKLSELIEGGQLSGGARIEEPPPATIPAPAPVRKGPGKAEPWVQQHPVTKEYRHSYDGGKTWLPGRP